MSNTPIQDSAARALSSDSGRTLPSRHLQSISVPSASKRVCFYKSGDYKFSGHRMVINTRTLKTFDALLDALSKKVPLPFGVRTITTPRGTHLVKGLDDLHDGGAYVCSDQRRVKPLNLNEVNRQQIPWNPTRPLSARRQRRLHLSMTGRRNDVAKKTTRVSERVAVRTPKRFMVIKNKDPTVKCTIVLHRKTAPTFDALLDYLSEILQFPVLKLFSTDGRRVDSLGALILCSGVVVAAGNEPFRLGNYSFHRTSQMAQVMHMETVDKTMLQPRAPKENNKIFSSRKGLRNFSLSSEQYIVNQINKSQIGDTNSHLHHHSALFEPEVSQHHTSSETCRTGRVENNSCILPHEDDIEKSFRVNQDGSMTVEMKVHLTIKEEEMLHWTTTLSRASLCKRTAHASVSESGNSSPDSNNAVAKNSSSISEDDTKEENHPTGVGKGVCFNREQVYEDIPSKTLRKVPSIKRAPTPGPRHDQRKGSEESVKTVTESGVKESSLGHYSYMKRTADGETAQEYRVVRLSSSTSISNQPIPNPRKTASACASSKGSHSIKLSGVAEVLQIENNGIEVTERVMHINESQGYYDNNFANKECSVPLHGPTAASDNEPSTETRPHSFSNDIDFSRQPSTADSLQRLKGEILSLSSEPISSACEITNNLSRLNNNDMPIATKSQTEGTVKKIKSPQRGKNKKVTKNVRNDRNATSKNRRHSSTDEFNNSIGVGKNGSSSPGSAKSGQQSKGERKNEKSLSKKSIKDEKKPRKNSALQDNAEKIKSTLFKRQSTDKVAGKYNGRNVNTPTGRPQMKKNISDIFQSKKSFRTGNKTPSKPKSVTENRALSPKKPSELNESVSMPLLNPTPSEIHQYVENWLENVSQDNLPYIEAITSESEPQSKVMFQVGGDSESDEKNESQIGSAEYYPLSGDAVRHSGSSLSVPLHHERPETSNSNPTSNHEKSNSLPHFSTQVASVFGSSCETFMSFLSVMILRNNLKESLLEDFNQSGSNSEAMLMMQSLLKVSASEDKEQQKACLTELQRRASSHLTKYWKDFQMLRERLEIETLSGKENMFALDVVSEEGAMNELMEELNMPKDLRAEICLAIQRAKSFYLEESTLVETDRNQRDSVLSADGAKSAEPDDTSVENITEDIQETGPDEKCLKESQIGKDVILDAMQHESETDKDEDLTEEMEKQGQGEKTGEDRETNETNEEGVELENKAKGREEEGRTDEADNEVQNDSEAEKGSDQEHVGKMEEATDEEDKELEEGEEGMFEETDEREEGRDGVKEKIDYEIWEENDIDENQVDETKDESDKILEKTYKKVNREQEAEKKEKNEEEAEEMTDEELKNNDNVQEKEEVNGFTEDEEKAEKEELQNIFEDEEEEEEEEEMDVANEQGNEEKDKMELDCEENVQEVEKDGEAVVKNTRVVRDEQEEEQNIKRPMVIKHCSDEEPSEAHEVERLEDMKVEQTFAEEEREDYEEIQVEKQELKVKSKEKANVPGTEDRFDDDKDCKNAQEEVSCLQQNSSNHKKLNTKQHTESPTQHSSGGQCEHAKCCGTDNKFETDEQGQHDKKSLLHAVEISQELLDCVNLALQSSSLIFTYDAWGIIRLEPDNARVVQTKNIIIPKVKKDSLYGSKCLPSPSTSDLSDYRPDTSDSGGYKTQDSVDIVTDSGEEASRRCSPVHGHENRETNDERVMSKPSLGSIAESLQSSTLKSVECFSAFDSGMNASKEDLSYYSGVTSLRRTEIELVPEATQCFLRSEKTDGVLIDRGRWLLKENHLIRRSPPFSQEMYDDVDSTSTDTGQEKTSEDSLTHYKTQQNPLVAISSSELEEMSKPQTPKCNYFNMPHGSDSDPFLDDSSVHSGKKQRSSVKGREFRVSPIIDTTKTWPNKSGSPSSFASVEFKMHDGKVHPEGESSSVRQTRRTSSGGRHVLQAQDPVDSLNVTCGQYCPIL